MAIGYDYYDAAKLIIEAGGDISIKNLADFAAERGLEGDKSLGVAALVSAKTAEDVGVAFTLCEQKLDYVDKASFVAAGMKAKKLLQGSWSDALQDKFKEITAKL
mmetsp:Transcript_9826/g.13492  ORF Transcript_9826/g.13492 Transcript_9826/m.13492 type:complete len:105 (+) Transcript_9826:242-556(+)